ncbi:MAG: NAD(P)H-hydrate dehydratase [Anaerolineaceae bacterium]|nr:NAD(P)H-hydrate dehydratase [Anaerolineaceae bacterium]
MKLLSVSEMKAIEQEADASGYSYRNMMEAAGTHLAEVIHTLYVPEEENIAVGIIGGGNNGGDALVALSKLLQFGWQVRAYVVKPRAADDIDLKLLQSKGVEITTLAGDKKLEKINEWIVTSSVIIDGILGTGSKLPVSADLSKVMAFIRDHDELPLVVAVDCPSGMDCDSGAVDDSCIPADVTVCMQAIKAGMLKFPAYSYLGELEVVSIDLPDDALVDKHASAEVIDQFLVEDHLPERDLDAHKGIFGTAMIVAGSLNYTGAAYLAGMGAYRTGTGLVRLAVPGPLHTALAGKFPEATWLLLPHELGVIAEGAMDVLGKNLEKVSAILIGPGIGTENTTSMFMKRLLNKEIVRGKKNSIGFLSAEMNPQDKESTEFPHMVIDADGLKLLAKHEDWYKSLPENTILTPHPGEMAILADLSVDEIQNDRIQIAKQYAKKWHQIVVLKGAMTVVAAADGRCGVLPVATPALSKAGTGDVLAGIITGLLAQGVPAFEAAAAGVWLHAQAGLVAESWHGSSATVMATDLLDALPEVFSDLW